MPFNCNSSKTMHKEMVLLNNWGVNEKGAHGHKMRPFCFGVALCVLHLSANRLICTAIVSFVFHIKNSSTLKPCEVY